VDVNTTLSEAVDPVCSIGSLDACADFGLAVNPGIILDLGGCTIRGTQTSTVGISAGPGATVRSGKVTGFGIFGVFLHGNNGRISNLQVTDGAITGIAVSGNNNRVEKSIMRRHGQDGVGVDGSGNVISSLQVSDSAFSGIEVNGANNTVEKSIVSRSVVDGISLSGNGNKALLNTAEDSGFNGLTASGDNLVLARNRTERNRFCGIRLSDANSDRGVIDRNPVRFNDSVGLCVEGTSHTVSRNVVASNGVDGILVDARAAGNVFDRNRSTSNEHFGIHDLSVGGGTTGTANTYKGNVCSGNGIADSRPGGPAGLCR
jgi:hypothetical protein